MGEVHRLDSCRRCRRIFEARSGERLCPDCRRQQRREAGRRALTGATSGWGATGTFALATLGLGIITGYLHPGWTGTGAWVGGALAVAYIARR